MSQRSSPSVTRLTSDGFGASEGDCIKTPHITAAELLSGLPDTLREELLARYSDTLRNYRNQHWEAASLNAGKFAEVVYTILRGRADGKYPERAVKPQNMVDACRALEKEDEARMGGHGMRITIPRAIPPIYDIRNNRGVGHAGAEIDPAHMDAEFAFHACQWMLAELVRVYHNLVPETARQVIDALVEREMPLIWEVEGTRRVLDTTLGAAERVLLLLYGSPAPVDEDTLCQWSEYQNVTRFKKNVLPDLHARALIHYDKARRVALISPLGVRYVEAEIVPPAHFRLRPK